ncbi:MAG: hypothetical protein EOP73_28870, partial [Variovorax sp.]
PTAAYEPERTAAHITTALARCGAQAEVVPLAPNLPGVDIHAVLNDPAVIARVAASQAVFFSGGAQEHIVDTLQARGEETPMLGAIRAVFAAGGVVAGTSAGAAVMSRLMFRDAMDSLAVMKGLWREGREYERGLGFVDAALLVDQHFLKRGRIGRLLPALQSLQCRMGLGIDENAAVVIQDSQLEVIGASGAVLVDMAQATHDPALGAFNLRGARLSYRAQGDRHDLATGQTTPAARKQRTTRVDSPAPGPGLAPEPSSHRYFLDMLGEASLLGALNQLLDSPADEVRGLAYRANPPAGERLPYIGFEFRLRRGPAFAGWRDPAAASDDGTVLDAQLDVVPVRVANPLFTPLAAGQLEGANDDDDQR